MPSPTSWLTKINLPTPVRPHKNIDYFGYTIVLVIFSLRLYTFHTILSKKTIALTFFNPKKMFFLDN